MIEDVARVLLGECSQLGHELMVRVVRKTTPIPRPVHFSEGDRDHEGGE